MQAKRKQVEKSLTDIEDQGDKASKTSRVRALSPVPGRISFPPVDCSFTLRHKKKIFLFLTLRV